MSKEIKQNLINQLSKIKTFLIGSEHQLFDDVKVGLTDWEFNEDGIIMVLVSLRFESYVEPDLENFIGHINSINDKLYKLMDKIAFDPDGNLKPPRGNVASFSGGILISDIIYSFRTEEVLTIEVDCMFHRSY